MHLHHFQKSIHVACLPKYWQNKSGIKISEFTVNTSSVCVSTFYVCVNKFDVCVNNVHVCLNKFNECVNKFNVCVNKFNVCVNRFNVCVNKFLVYVCRNHQIYYTYGFLLLVIFLLLIICAESTMIICYFHLNAQVMFHFTSYELKYCCKHSVSKHRSLPRAT